MSASGASGGGSSNPGASSSSTGAKDAGEIEKAENMVKMIERLALTAAGGSKTTAAKTEDEAARKQYRFWETQPVPKINERVEGKGVIEPDKQPDQVRQNAYDLPKDFEWDTLDINQEDQLKELYKLLNENYVEDDDNMFRFDYSPEFLKWALQPPHWVQDWHCGIRVTKSKKLVGFISAIPAQVNVCGEKLKTVEINFLCVLKQLRSKRMAPVLISEITRRVHLHGIFQAVYTAGVVIPKPVGTCRYWHRSLNPKKLIEVKFSHLNQRMTLARTIKLYKLPEVSCCCRLSSNRLY
jgi:glycylpeptide N-tetradecanoyltransferase